MKKKKKENHPPHHHQEKKKSFVRKMVKEPWWEQNEKGPFARWHVSLCFCFGELGLTKQKFWGLHEQKPLQT